MQIYILMGVSGVGKTTIGKLLSEKLGLPFYDADDFHPPGNVEKMENGIPLTDEDRKAWLELLAIRIRDWSRTSGAILACSALKESYRKKLQSSSKKYLHWIFLHSEYEVILARMMLRKDHYFKPDLLQSQFDNLEIPQYGIHINVNSSRESIVEEIMEKLKQEAHKSKIGLIGLGVMGKSLALNLASNGVRISVYNRQIAGTEVDIARNFAKQHENLHVFPWFDELESFVTSLERPRNLILMVSAGKAVDAVIENVQPFLEKGDLIIDGGNSHYKDTLRREQHLSTKGILFMGVGISGGEEGARKGPSIMPGGAPEAYQRVGGFLEIIAARDKQGQPCCTYIGPGGAGHFVKMLHNGIEYGEMQLIAEFYHFLRYHTNSGPDAIAELFEDWNKSLKSYLLEITIDILRRKEEGDFLIDKVLDAAGQKGTGGWSTNAALDLGVAFDTITASVMARNISAQKERRQIAEAAYAFHSSDQGELEKLAGDLFKAYQLGSIINHATGFSLLKEASEEYNWKLDLSEVARVWTNGCIIRSQFMEDLVGILKEAPSEDILLHSTVVELVKASKPVLLKSLSEALQAGYPMPVLAAAANYLLSYTSGHSSANIIQAQRDYFGAHTYERSDRPRGEHFHSDWKKE